MQANLTNLRKGSFDSVISEWTVVPSFKVSNKVKWHASVGIKKTEPAKRECSILTGKEQDQENLVSLSRQNL